MFERLREGVRGARAEAGCWSAIRFIGITALFVSPFIAMIPAMAQLVFDGTAVDTAHFTMAQGLGSVVGAFGLASAVRRFGRFRVTVVMLVALPLLVKYTSSFTEFTGKPKFTGVAHDPFTNFV